ncbi:MAG TPA: mannose-6-phosphate isomerase, class I [Saprospiraceae bacterium]|nr:mannose-6-phosphate isomerase, class I [Saprospiraceae bacterium]HMQ82424.1 mannose-6-phosphate isomerase, class I [Saprospiraceae bacterium]
MTLTLLPIKGAVQHYAWGGYQYIPRLLGIKNESEQPYAELWLGAHNSSPALACRDKEFVALDQLLLSNTEWLGEKILHQFGPILPYLLKILDVREMLSIQVHPNKEQAELGFLTENQQNIPLDAKHRNFKDNNHKPELMVALSDFWLLHGFKTEVAIDRILETVPEFQRLKPFFAEKSIYELYKHIMEMPYQVVESMLGTLNKRLLSEAPHDKESEDYWALRAFEMMGEGTVMDRGIFSIYLFNLLHLHPGEAIFQGAGVPHAYLEGINVELMANSDNVFRGGLTVKHVDVSNLLKHLIFEPIIPQIIREEKISEQESIYPTAAPDFQLNKIQLRAGETYKAQSTEAPEIFLVIEGAITANNGLSFHQGESFFLPVHQTYSLYSEAGCVVFKATLPDEGPK